MKKKYFGSYPRDEDKYLGEYIAVVRDKIIAHGKNLKKVFEQARKVAEEPLLVKVPALGWRQSMVLWLSLKAK